MFDEFRISEASRRWADFQGGRPIELPDGNVWWFYEPAAFNRSADRGVVVPSWTFGAEVHPTLDLALAQSFAKIITRWSEAKAEDKTATLLEAAWFLLARNYDINPAEFQAILSLASTQPEARQAALGKALGSLVDDACSRSLSHAEGVV